MNTPVHIEPKDDDPVAIAQAVALVERAIANLIALKLGDLGTLASTPLGRDLRTGHACITIGYMWPDRNLMMKLSVKGMAPMELMDVDLAYRDGNIQ
jgi:hypothetical protein